MLSMSDAGFGGVVNHSMQTLSCGSWGNEVSHLRRAYCSQHEDMARCTLRTLNEAETNCFLGLLVCELWSD